MWGRGAWTRTPPGRPTAAATSSSAGTAPPRAERSKHAHDYYGWAKAPERGDKASLKAALRVVRKLHGHSSARDFGPLALKACRAGMVRKGWARTYVNSQVDRLRRMFRWAAEEGLLSGSVHDNLTKVVSLQKGKCEARVPFSPRRCRAHARPAGYNEVAMLGLLTVVAGPDQGRTFLLKDGISLLLGRGAAAQAALRDRGVSRAHCQVEAAGVRVSLLDVGSLAATYANGERVTRALLKPGDILTLNSTRIAFRWSDIDQRPTEPYPGREEGAVEPGGRLSRDGRG